MIGIITKDFDNAIEIIKSYSCYVAPQRIRRTSFYAELEDGTMIQWFSSLNAARGYKFDKMYVLKSAYTDDMELYSILIPCVNGDGSKIVWID